MVIATARISEQTKQYWIDFAIQCGADRLPPPQFDEYAMVIRGFVGQCPDCDERVKLEPIDYGVECKQCGKKF
jgi:hypothetical protein